MVWLPGRERAAVADSDQQHCGGPDADTGSDVRSSTSDGSTGRRRVVRDSDMPCSGISARLPDFVRRRATATPHKGCCG
jgi:hypothetical protein